MLYRERDVKSSVQPLAFQLNKMALPIPSIKRPHFFVFVSIPSRSLPLKFDQIQCRESDARRVQTHLCSLNHQIFGVRFRNRSRPPNMELDDRSSNIPKSSRNNDLHAPDLQQFRPRVPSQNTLAARLGLNPQLLIAEARNK